MFCNLIEFTQTSLICNCTHRSRKRYMGNQASIVLANVQQSCSDCLISKHCLISCAYKYESKQINLSTKGIKTQVHKLVLESNNKSNASHAINEKKNYADHKFFKRHGISLWTSMLIFTSLRQKWVTISCDFSSTGSILCKPQNAEHFCPPNFSLWDIKMTGFGIKIKKFGWFTGCSLLLGARENRSGVYIYFTSMRIWRSMELYSAIALWVATAPP